jgi:iron complex transport system substrate-binding protein
VLPDTEINFESVAALQPDLILAVHSGFDRGEFEKLSKIAPTVAQSGKWGEYQTPWSK